MANLVDDTTVQLVSRIMEHGMVGGAALLFYWEKRKAEKRERELYERHTAKSEKWNEKYSDLVRDMRQLIESIERKI